MIIVAFLLFFMGVVLCYLSGVLLFDGDMPAYVGFALFVVGFLAIYAGVNSLFTVMA